ncbi:hypothetical protein F53441_13360 [Fusarium austroafricanum]|uniref:Uncharacterized protein n=1 Tax=Fusarium austroafricanum TaxID=2364996 RepID=A0A8H4NFP0_9HYPO|nr:hypothetical protein F53441_13360 [Fusarium austroafricanum]
MPPIVILDSDDDEDGSFSPPPDVRMPFSLAPPEAEAANDSSGRVSRATTSTNPSFFQNIYNEQNDAARGYVPEPTARSHDQDQQSISSSEMTAPAPFKRTVTGIIEPSSFSSTRDQPAAREQRMAHRNGYGPDEWTQASTPGRRKAPTAIMDDPWGVPSSPDESPVRPKIKIKVKRSGAQSGSTRDSQRPQESEKAPGSRSGRADNPPSGKKRRKASHSEPSFQGSNEVDLVTIPFSHDHQGEYHESQPAPTPSMLPPTLPINEDDSFFIAPNHLTDAQKLEYESVQLHSSDSPNHQLPPVRQFEINLASSGDATNVNTPRSNATYLMSTAPPPPASVMDLPRATIGQTTGHQWDSSPDVISAIDSPPRQKATKHLLEQTRHGDSPEPANNEILEAQQTEQPELPAMQEAAFDNYEPEKVAKTKKSRGRPKKKAAEEAVPVAQTEVATPIEKAKKKRGRPRKSEQPDKKEESPKVDQSASTNDASLSEEAERPEKKAKVEAEEDESKDELAEETEMGPSLKSNSRESPVLKESDPYALTKSVSSMDDDAMSKASHATTAEKEEKQQKQQKPAISSRTSTPSKGLSSIINKPVYRVGLSKKSRIAPLLKCLQSTLPGNNNDNNVIPMTKEAAARMQGAEAKNSNDAGFAAHAQAAGDKNANEAAKSGNSQGKQKK